MLQDTPKENPKTQAPNTKQIQSTKSEWPKKLAFWILVIWN
jgi:hypothetical protein